MKRLGLLIVAAAALALGAPSVALAQGWRGGGYRVYPHPGYGAPYGARPFLPAHTRVFVPGYWGFHSGVRVWIGGSWVLPPYEGWVWVPGNWIWNGYSWVWQDGYWSPPYGY